MTNKFLTIAIAITTITTSAQNEMDALRYSMQNITGTARYAAMGGAFGSLGGEFSALSSNPAGIGMYQYSEFTFTPSYNLDATKSYYKNSNLSAYKSKMSVGNIGLVFAIPKKDSNWKRINFGIGWNQLSNYNNTIKIEGMNNGNSIVDRIVEITNGTLIEDLTNGSAYSQMAWQTYLINPLTNENGLINGEYVSNFSSNPKFQTKTFTTQGSMNEFILSLGGSFQENLYVGATIGIPNFNYYEYSEFSERETSDTSNALRSMSFEEEISTQGTGYNLKIGAIYRLSDNLKIGGSIHTPTFFNITEDYNTSITTFFRDSTLDYSMGYLAPFNYNLITPLKASISASAIFNTILLSLEYEIIDYSKSKYFTTDLEEINESIKNIYTKSKNIKLGTEINIKPFVLRSGYSKYGSASAVKDFSREAFSYGLGINNGSYFVDVAYILSQGNSEHFLYSEDSSADLVNTNHSFLFTLGFRY